MQRQLARPVRLFLACPPGAVPGARRTPVAEMVDGGAALADVAQLLCADRLAPAGVVAAAVAPGAKTGAVARRADGSCISGLKLRGSDSVGALLDALTATLVRARCARVPCPDRMQPRDSAASMCGCMKLPCRVCPASRAAGLRATCTHVQPRTGRLAARAGSATE